MNKQQAKHAAKFTRDMLDLMNGNNGEHWTKKKFTWSFNWKFVQPDDGKLCYCVLGSARRLVEKGKSVKTADNVIDTIETEVGGNIPIWNDDLNTTWHDVKRVLIKVAKKFDRLATT